MMLLRVVFVLLVVQLVPCAVDARDFGPYVDLIPRNLLRLVHAPEVHEELSLSPGEISSLEQLFSEIDSRWFASRILPSDQQNIVLDELEGRVLEWFAANTKPAQQHRLRQLEYFSQAGRVVLRNDVARAVGLPESDREALAELARMVSDIERTLGRSKFGDSDIPKLQADLRKRVQAERTGLKKHVGATQRRKLSELLGRPFDTTKLTRIYPMAPEFVNVEDWINTAPLRLENLRGKVVLIHFYAFQCHNCHANFEIYKRWHKELAEKGVVVVGIQTPETRRERDPSAVRSAAKERELDFPILIDLESKNWKAWGNTMWPTVYVVDKDGYIRHWWQGELNWKGATGDKAIEDLVEKLLADQS